MIDWAAIQPVLWRALVETLQMVATSLLVTVLIGLPVGVLLVVMARGGVLEAPFGSRPFGRTLHTALGFITNIGRSVPFVILIIALIPFTRWVMGSSIGTDVMWVPLSVAAIPFFARLVEIAVREVDLGLVEAAHSLGAGRWQVVRKVLVPEALPGIVLGLSTTVISLINYSAMAGVLGGGGLGDVAYRYGFQRYQDVYMVATIVILVVLVQVLQSLGSLLARRLSHR